MSLAHCSRRSHTVCSGLPATAAEIRRRSLAEADELRANYLKLESFMAERRPRAQNSGIQRGATSRLRECWKSSPGAGRQPFSGKSFYLDLPAGRTLQFLTGAIQQLGGVIEGFLSKEVSYIVSSRREAKAENGEVRPRSCSSPREVRLDTPSTARPKGSPSRPVQIPADTVPLSRGKELLQKAIRNQGISCRTASGSRSTLLTDARCWGVRVLHVDEMMMHVQQLSLGSSCVKKQELKRTEGTPPGAESRTRKVARLKAPFLKVEDVSRNFRPFHHQFKCFPEISFLGPKDTSPFEASVTPGSLHQTRELKDQEPSPRSAARTVPKRKKGYCECCQEAFAELHVHLRSAQHQRFALEARPYAEVDRLIAQLSHSFVHNPAQAVLPRQSGSLASDSESLCPETQPPSPPAHPMATSPRIKEDNCQAPGAPEQDETAGTMIAAAGSSEMQVSRSPTCQCLLTSSGSMDLSSGPDLALAGHKRKVQFPSGDAKKKPGASLPQASFFSSRTTGDKIGVPYVKDSGAGRGRPAFPGGWVTVTPEACLQAEACSAEEEPEDWDGSGPWVSQRCSGPFLQRWARRTGVFAKRTSSHPQAAQLGSTPRGSTRRVRTPSGGHTPAPGPQAGHLESEPETLGPRRPAPAGARASPAGPAAEGPVHLPGPGAGHEARGGASFVLPAPGWGPRGRGGPGLTCSPLRS
ncbi:protein DBF4 homolog B [Ctenodactylus gundi]